MLSGMEQGLGTRAAEGGKDGRRGAARRQTTKGGKRHGENSVTWFTYAVSFCDGLKF